MGTGSRLITIVLTSQQLPDLQLPTLLGPDKQQLTGKFHTGTSHDFSVEAYPAVDPASQEKSISPTLNSGLFPNHLITNRQFFQRSVVHCCWDTDT